jgi:SAM-dependent methyltransferase
MSDITEQIEIVYSRQYKRIGSILPERGSDYQIELIRKFIPKNPLAKILDAGCGNGAYANIFQKSGYQKIYAVDLFKEINTKEILYTKASIDSLPFENDTFDFIYSLSVIYYLPSIEKTFGELYRVLKPGSTIIITGHTKYSLFTAWRVTLRKLFNKQYEHLNEAKFNTCSSYVKKAKAVGFTLEYRDGFVLSFILVPLFRIIRKHFPWVSALKKRTEQKDFIYINNNLVKIIKSEFAYHFAIVLKKPER